ncbi:MAG: hypothetical protein LBP98_00775, partial [Tannerella sp.]|nr:hypothetical protein [Tannerella sp.]
MNRKLVMTAGNFPWIMADLSGKIGDFSGKNPGCSGEILDSCLMHSTGKAAYLHPFTKRHFV